MITVVVKLICPSKQAHTTGVGHTIVVKCGKASNHVGESIFIGGGKSVILYQLESISSLWYNLDVLVV